MRQAREDAAEALRERRDVGRLAPAAKSKSLQALAEKLDRIAAAVEAGETAPDVAKAELESAEKAGTPYYRQLGYASGGVAVANLGGSRANDLIWRDIRVSKAGRYRIEVRYLTEERTAFNAQIDYGQVIGVSVDNTKCKTGSYAVEVGLAKGMHTVRLFNGTGRMPDIDALLVTRVK